jgi:hypothetical protein
VKRFALAPLVALVAVAALFVAPAPALAANHEITLSGETPLTVGKPTIIRAAGVVAPAAEFWDSSWIEIVALSPSVIGACPADSQSAGSVAEETGGAIISIFNRPAADEAGNFANSFGFTPGPGAAGGVLFCGYLYNEVGYTWAGSTLRVDVVGTEGTPSSSGPSGPSGSGTAPAGHGPVNTARPWVSSSRGRLVCHPGTWSGATGAYAYNWLLDGRLTRVTGAKPRSPLPVARGHRVACRVTAYDAAGSGATADSRPLRLH